MAVLIHNHHRCCHPATTSSAAVPLFAHHTRAAKSQPNYSIPLSGPSPYLSNAKSQLFAIPSSSLTIQQPCFQNTLETSTATFSKNEVSDLLRLSVQCFDVGLTKCVHSSILRNQEPTFLFNSLISSYLGLGHVDYARKVFNSLESKGIVSYTAMISGLTRSGHENEAVALFFEMRGLGIEPNEYTFVALLTTCVSLFDLELGSQVHSHSIKTGYFDCSYVANTLTALYGKCGCLDSMLKLFNLMPHRDIASWNTVISCLVKEGIYDQAFELFQDMLKLGKCRGDYFTFSSLLISCARCFAVMEGRQIHAYAYKAGYENNLSVKNSLVEFYSQCGCVEDVEALFEEMPVRDVITWTEMIGAYMKFGLVDLAVEVFRRMPEKSCISYNAVLAGFCRNGMGFRAFKLFYQMVMEGLELTDFTLTSVLNACGLMMDYKTSEQIYGFILKFGLSSNNCIETSLLDMCTRCGRMDDAEELFHQLLPDQRSSFLLTSMVCGYARNAEPDKAISMFCQWHHEGLGKVDEVASASILGVCGELGFQELGEQFHCMALKYGFLHETGLGNALVSMYSKCGNMEQAIEAFDGITTFDVVSWNSLLSGHILNRQGGEALNAWRMMENAGMQPDTITCALVISAYQHTDSNLAESCHDFFTSMKSNYNIEPNSDHYACFIGVLGYWGHLEEAEEVINKMPFEPNVSVLRSLLDSCRMHMNATIGKRVSKKILDMDSQDPSAYILKSNLYSASGRWHCSEIVREEMRSKGLQKFPGRSWIVHENYIHSFFARDRSHAQFKDILSGLEILYSECLKAGYKPDTSFVLHEVEEHQKVNFLLYHSGKLAVTYGLLAIKPGKPIRVVKNIHLCGDCHSFFKYVSIITKRVIQVRDTSGFHIFDNGECSCRGK